MVPQVLPKSCARTRDVEKALASCDRHHVTNSCQKPSQTKCWKGEPVLHPRNLTANAPENRPKPKRKLVFQPSFFRGELLNFGGVNAARIVKVQLTKMKLLAMQISHANEYTLCMNTSGNAAECLQCVVACTTVPIWWIYYVSSCMHKYIYIVWVWVYISSSNSSSIYINLCHLYIVFFLWATLHPPETPGLNDHPRPSPSRGLCHGARPQLYGKRWSNHYPSLKRRANAPENRPKPKRKLESYIFQGITFQVLCISFRECYVFLIWKLHLNHQPVTSRKPVAPHTKNIELSTN